MRLPEICHAPRFGVGLVGLICAVVLAACGDSNEKTATTPAPPETVSYDQYGISFATETSWAVLGGIRPHVSTVSSGAAKSAIWRFQRTERLPRTKAELQRALLSLTAASRRRDATFRRVSGRTLRLDGRPAVEIRGTDRAGGRQRATLTTHIYAFGAEIVIDQFTTQADYARADRSLFGPLLDALQIRRPNP